jgi:hypothetical protein
VIVIRLGREPEVNADPAGRRPGAGPAFRRAEFGGPRSSCTPWCGMARQSVAGARRAVNGAVRVELFQRGHPLVCAARARRRRMTSHRDRAHGYTTRPKRPTTWPSRSAVSSSPPDFAVVALTGSRRRKPGPFRQTGLPPEHDQRSCEIRGVRRRPILGWLICGYEIRGLKPQVIPEGAGPVNLFGGVV